MAFPGRWAVSKGAGQQGVLRHTLAAWGSCELPSGGGESAFSKRDYAQYGVEEGNAPAWERPLVRQPRSN